MPRTSANHSHIAVVGAGPFGLALAARLGGADADFVLLGKPMSFWRDHVPRGTRLLTDMLSCSLAHEGSPLDCGAYERALGTSVSRRLSADEFIAYGLWFHRQSCPDADERTVVHITRGDRRFALRLDYGNNVTA